MKKKNRSPRSFWLDKNLLRIVDQICENLHTTKSNFIEDAVKVAIKTYVEENDHVRKPMPESRLKVRSSELILTIRHPDGSASLTKCPNLEVAKTYLADGSVIVKMEKIADDFSGEKELSLDLLKD